MTNPAPGTGPRRTPIGDAERDRYIAALREHYVGGRLSLEELRRRAEKVLRAEYLDEAASVLDDLPGVLPAVAGAPGAVADGSRAGWYSRRGHAQVSKPAAGWVPTAERFRDPSTGVVMRVWVDPADESRHYVPDAQ